MFEYDIVRLIKHFTYNQDRARDVLHATRKHRWKSIPCHNCTIMFRIKPGVILKIPTSKQMSHHRCICVPSALIKAFNYFNYQSPVKESATILKLTVYLLITELRYSPLGNLNHHAHNTSLTMHKFSYPSFHNST